MAIWWALQDVMKQKSGDFSTTGTRWQRLQNEMRLMMGTITHTQIVTSKETENHGLLSQKLRI